jgi:hypothetical protein
MYPKDRLTYIWIPSGMFQRAARRRTANATATRNRPSALGISGAKIVPALATMKDLPKPVLQGIVPALVTPFQEDELIDYNAWQVIVDTLIGAGVDGLFVGGSTGESVRWSWTSAWYPCVLPPDRRRTGATLCRRRTGSEPVDPRL